MAQTTKVFAPEGYHFMVKKNGNFYLMKGAYTAHTLANGDKSSEYVNMQYLTSHPVSGTMSSSSSRSARTAGPSVRTTAGTVTNTSGRSTTTSMPTRSTSSGSSGGGY
jgi:hypothetical protein